MLRAESRVICFGYRMAPVRRQTISLLHRTVRTLFRLLPAGGESCPQCSPAVSSKRPPRGPSDSHRDIRRGPSKSPPHHESRCGSRGLETAFCMSMRRRPLCVHFGKQHLRCFSTGAEGTDEGTEKVIDLDECIRRRLEDPSTFLEGSESEAMGLCSLWSLHKGKLREAGPKALFRWCAALRMFAGAGIRVEESELVSVCNEVLRGLPGGFAEGQNSKETETGRVGESLEALGHLLHAVCLSDRAVSCSDSLQDAVVSLVPFAVFDEPATPPLCPPSTAVGALLGMAVGQFGSREKLKGGVKTVKAVGALLGCCSARETGLQRCDLMLLKLAISLLGRQRPEILAELDGPARSFLECLVEPCTHRQRLPEAEFLSEETETEEASEEMPPGSSSSSSSFAEPPKFVSSFEKSVSDGLLKIEVPHEPSPFHVGIGAFSLRNPKLKALYVCERESDYYRNQPQNRRALTKWRYMLAGPSYARWHIFAMPQEKVWRRLSSDAERAAALQRSLQTEVLVTFS
uniref:Uncharacterized protein n=1 Tax=Chromera velia CCMP2878 TaxID=1169474 RepID=A0A0G4GQI4_9ALVE|eukprot:Cvel_22924.t1-p1 / transcript=Cvel_22924.t1 / gene=Cvel_22924 / organism=Chromera_velia_CCMP2878 / gene_product=hypothetical protein / transcript_product=hypothetical protein / location=Cvel_scaffold2305:24171-28655(-) / protein_length=516 / sequence_SO=supercontig / SO=protein_coding / is_pseudo=false